ncbi:hypothetical protein D0B32_16255 [Paraburkholderia sp. DHOC27]|nr:hypothetical protein D0B32_16255 [Paraburkholderia sp. DHOC27]
MTGRVLVPADGWFEWRLETAPEDEREENETGNGAPESQSASASVLAENESTGQMRPPTRHQTDAMFSKQPVRQPYYVRLKRDEPMYLAALSNVQGTQPQTEGMGLVIVTATADAGLIDVHDRRPLVFGPKAARRWLDPAISGAEIDDLARHAGEPAAKFRWYRVSLDVERPLVDEPRLIEALQ